ncbi:hypothetical protein GCM10009584_25320 [Ornithinimicrobium humiphilum]|uniref:UDP-N-acetylmuramyl pentapeptide phosphotransferase/UDP-N-acetylglucosamine-1-phosphate transferase n=1 Tax=Ornithinimicrobium humiphilum TaxID=125288 RepID=A0A543KPQ4_9MICO|nr:hypothetical protein [Ornithinimicrobium humiphilum]TQM97048.1 hypothetical protein FB476_1944 [Ornithinimicrobium humiphilum]
MRALPTAALCAATAAAATAGVLALHRAGRLPGGSRRWERTNHAGDTVTLVEGLALAAGTTAPLVLLDPPAALAVAGAAVAGAADDLAGSATAAKGLRGHLTALRRGEVTTGALKIALLAGSGLAACAWVDRRQGRHDPLATLAGAGLVAGSANLANLFDLRPGRALKVFLAPALPLALAGSPAAGATAGSAAVVLRDDLRGTTMLGDTGANPLGAAVGVAAARALGTRGRWAALAVVTALTLASERVSFSQVIDSTPVLRRLDRWGRPS